MKTRIITGSLIGLAVAGFFALRQLINPFIFDVLIAFILIFGTMEVSKVFNKDNKHNYTFVSVGFASLSFVAVLLGVFFELSLLNIMLIILALFLLSAFLSFSISFIQNSASENTEKSEVNSVFRVALRTMFVCVYPTVFLLSLEILNHLGELGITATSGTYLGLFSLVILFATTMMTDVFAYFVGSFIKGRKLCPTISPNKTISGAIGGILGGLLASLICFVVFGLFNEFSTIFTLSNLNVWLVTIYGILGSIISQFGDIFASLIKRKVKTKDFGNVFPGHGGIMDRCDALAFNAVFTTILFVILF